MPPSVEEDLYSRLAADSDVASIVGTRIYPYNKLPNIQLPALVYQRVSTIPVRGLNGPHDLESVRMQITAWGDTYLQTVALASAVKDALDGTEQTTFENQVDRFDTEVKRNYCVLDFIVWHAP